MTTQQYKTRSGATQLKPVVTIKEAWAMDNASEGFCLACGYVQDECEPDAERYTCDECGLQKVYGFSELVVLGLAMIVE